MRNDLETVKLVFIETLGKFIIVQVMYSTIRIVRNVESMNVSENSHIFDIHVCLISLLFLSSDTLMVDVRLCYKLPFQMSECGSVCMYPTQTYF